MIASAGRLPIPSGFGLDVRMALGTIPDFYKLFRAPLILLESSCQGVAALPEPSLAADE